MTATSGMLSVLARARELVARGWVQGASAVGPSGEVYYNNLEATKFCATGALWRAIHDSKTIDTTHLRVEMYDYLSQYTLPNDLITFNDDTHTTQQDVLELLDTAIQDLEEDQDDDHGS